ncbi:MAG TPA: hypothetical protein VMV17_22100 [Streptosporangiaceae bacterium]|nr:hypothetical protein [Streptosporangiaceae bacterium]
MSAGSSRHDVVVGAARMRWAGQFHPVPEPLDCGGDAAGSWLVTAALPGESAAVSPRRAAGPATAALDHAAAIPPADRLVVCHGDACAPNTLLGRGTMVRACRPRAARHCRPVSRPGRRRLEC